MKKSQLKYSLVVLAVSLVSSVCFGSASPLPPNTYQVLRCNFHTHTMASDGQYTPAQVVNIYKNAGYDVLAITDHNTIDSYIEARTEGNRIGLTVICGEEIGARNSNWADDSFKHVIALFIHETITNDGSVWTWFDKIHAQGGIGIVAHPWDGWSNWQNYKTAIYIDGWEVDSATHQNWDWVYRSDLIYLRDHDFHADSLMHILPKHWTYVLAESRTEAGVKEALTAGRIIVYENGELHGSTYALSLLIQNQDLISLSTEIPILPFLCELASLAFGSRPGDSNWNQAADLNNDDVVDIFDIVSLANNFGKTT